MTSFDQCGRVKDHRERAVGYLHNDACGGELGGCCEPRQISQPLGDARRSLHYEVGPLTQSGYLR